MENTKNEAVTCSESQPPQESQEGVGTQAKGPEGGEDATWNLCESETEKGLRETRPSQHSKKVMKHALRQQAKRRRKNTTIAAGNPAPVQRHALSPNTCDIEEVNCDTACYRQPTMAEVLASIPGFSMKPRKRSQKKLSAAAQLEQTKEGCVDLETPDSILVNSNLRSLLNKHTFSSLPPLYQYKLLQLLPHVDRTGSDSVYRLSGSGLNNEFFARACLDWRERLAEGEFTPENQAKIKAEHEKEKSKLDPWKLKHFEPTWGESLKEWPSLPISSTSTSPVSQIKQKVVKPTPPPAVTRLRTVGAVTRAVTSYREKRAALSPPRQTEVKRNRHTDSDRSEKRNDYKEGMNTEEINSDISVHSLENESSEGTRIKTRKVESQNEKVVSPVQNVLNNIDGNLITDTVNDNCQENNLSFKESEEMEIVSSKETDEMGSSHELKTSRRTGEEEIIEESQNNEFSIVEEVTKTISVDQSSCNAEDSQLIEQSSEVPSNKVNSIINDLNVSSFSLKEKDPIEEMPPSPLQLEKRISPPVVQNEINSPEKSVCDTDEYKNAKHQENLPKHIPETLAMIETDTHQLQKLEEQHMSFSPMQKLEIENEDIKKKQVPDENSILVQQLEPPENSVEQLTVFKEESCLQKQDVDISQNLQHQDNEIRYLQHQLDQHQIIHSQIEQPPLVQQGHEQSRQQQQLDQSQILHQQHNHPMHIQQQHDHSLHIQHQHDQSQLLEHQRNQPQILPQQQHSQTQIIHQHGQTQLLHQQHDQTQIFQQQQQVEQSHLHHQNQGPQTMQQQMEHSQFLHQQLQQPHILQSSLEQPQVLQQQPETLQQQIETLQQQIEHSENLQKQIEQPESLQHSVDPLLKPNVLMMQQMVLDVQQVNNNAIKSEITIPVSLPNEPDNLNEMNTVITIPVSNEQPLPELHVVNDPSISNVPIMNEVILSDVPVSNSQVISDRGNIGEEKWEVIQVNPGEKEGLYFKEEEAAILAAAWDVVGSSSHFQDLHQPVSVIPCQEELEVRLQESHLPAPQWVDYTASSDNKQPSGHVKLELEVTLTPEVDSQVSSSSTEGASESVRVIPPTTIVCLPPLTASAPPPPPPPPASSSALPYLALTTSTPVRAVPTKPVQTKSGGGRGGRGSNNKPPPGAVNLERSYQICQAVIQNSPNRHQLRCQLKPPPPALLGKRLQQQPPPRQKPRQQTVVLRHMITSNSGGIPVNMAVLPSHPSHVPIKGWMGLGMVWET